MQKQWLRTLMVSGLLAGGTAQAADHRDGPGVTATTGDPATDITDVYAWTSSDGARVNLIMNVQGANTGATATTRFSNSALYVFRMRSQAAFNSTSGTSGTIVCSFGAGTPQTFQCWGPNNEYVTGSTGTTAGTTSTSGRLRVAALLREDAFPFNIRGFRATAALVNGAITAGAFTPDAAGCLPIDAATSAGLVGSLRSDGAGGAGRDDFGVGGASPPQSGVITNGNVLSIVVSVDRTLINAGGPILRVWGSTNRTP